LDLIPLFWLINLKVVCKAEVPSWYENQQRNR